VQGQKKSRKFSESEILKLHIFGKNIIYFPQLWLTQTDGYGDFPKSEFRFLADPLLEFEVLLFEIMWNCAQLGKFVSKKKRELCSFRNNQRDSLNFTTKLRKLILSGDLNIF
jgi:hypothetical protein